MKKELVNNLEFVALSREKIVSEIGKVIVGQHEIIDQLLIALFSGGHVLIVGVPGLAKTLLVKTLASILDLKFSRIQFTPDLMPSDIIGTDIIEEDLETGRKHFKFVAGPIFANMILADEINRTPPKTQSALLEAMQELKVTVNGRDYFLEPPFFVLATQNPIEQEGTYLLPEAQLDRFMFELRIDYPSYDEEKQIVVETTAPEVSQPEKVLERNEILELQKFVRMVPAPDHVVDYAVRLVRASRPKGEFATKMVKDFVEWGAGPRASQFLILGAKARALLRGKPVPTIEDVKAIAYPVLRHRIIVNFAAEAEGITSEDIIADLLENVSES
ncbi:MAG: AAA family ATPase [Candidatus Hydrothermota bacterium]|nr:MAG: AAA family ATPase [Candidatus Hydrothermae bacterium]